MVRKEGPDESSGADRGTLPIPVRFFLSFFAPWSVWLAPGHDHDSCLGSRCYPCFFPASFLIAGLIDEAASSYPAHAFVFASSAGTVRTV